MRLNDIQEKFRDLMLDDPAALESVPDDFAAVFAEGDIALAERLKVYRSNIVGGISDNFFKTFPLLEKLVGEDFLKQMIRAFVLAHPPSVGCLNAYGEGFPDFVRAYEPAQGLPYLPDMAALELAINRAYYAPDDAALNPQDLAALSETTLGERILSLRMSAVLISSPFALDALRKFCLEPEGEPPALQKPTFLMVYRPLLAVETLALAEDEYSFLLDLSDGAPLAEAAGRVFDNFARFDLQNFMQKHLALETFRAFSVFAEKA